MAANIEKEWTRHRGAAEALKSWTMIVMTLVFIVLYTTALVGWLKPLSDITMIARLEPIIFVIIGYYFGRFPSQQNETTLKEEIDRQIKKADAAQHLKEQVQNEREVMEEKIKNAKVALRSEIFETSGDVSHSISDIDPNVRIQSSAVERSGLLNRAVETVRKILDS
jgi:hypothetical protein